MDPDDDLELFVFERFLATISRAYDFHCNNVQVQDCARMSKGQPPEYLRFDPQLIIDQFTTDWFWSSSVDSDSSASGSDES